MGGALMKLNGEDIAIIGLAAVVGYLLLSAGKKVADLESDFECFLRNPTCPGFWPSFGPNQPDQ